MLKKRAPKSFLNIIASCHQMNLISCGVNCSYVKYDYDILFSDNIRRMYIIKKSEKKS